MRELSLEGYFFLGEISGSRDGDMQAAVFGTLNHVILYKFADISEVLTASEMSVNFYGTA
jgi:hypothetical protein